MTIDTTILNSLYKRAQARQITEILEQSPVFTRPTVTLNDVERKYMTRYFIRPVNDPNYIVEIDSTQYEQFVDNPRYITTEIKWKIIGKKESIKKSEYVVVSGVEEQNRNAVSQADLTFGGLQRYITNYLEFWFSER